MPEGDAGMAAPASVKSNPNRRKVIIISHYPFVRFSTGAYNSNARPWHRSKVWVGARPLCSPTLDRCVPITHGYRLPHYFAEILSHICRSSRSGSFSCRVSELNTITGRCDSLYGLQVGILE